MLAALSFLTVVGAGRAPDRRTLGWFPVVGAVVGLVLAGVLWGADQLWDPLVAGALVVVADLGVTGMLHLDGLADCADGLLPHMERGRRLAVMGDPEVGSFAVTVVAATLMLRWAALAALAGTGSGHLSLVGLWAGSRTLAAVVPSVVPYARPGGIASPFLEGSRRMLLLWLVPAGVLMYLDGGAGALVALPVMVAVAGAVVLLAVRRIGGFTGDVLGAVIVVGETLALLTLVAHG